MATPLLETLREQTRRLHQALDHHPQMMPLLDANITLEEYRDILCCMYPLQAGLEQHVAQLQQQLRPAVAPLPSRLPWLEQDLQQLHALPDQPQLPLWSVPATLGALAGLRYVADGARLGSAHIARRLQHTAPQLPRAYFAQAEGAMVWPQTLAFIQELDAVEHQHCVAVAKLAFAQYIAAFDNLNHK